MDLQEILDRMEPYDDSSREDFLRYLERHPELKEDLTQIILEADPKWVKRAETEVYFILNDNSWRIRNLNLPNSVKVHFVGPKELPIISLNIY